MSTNLQIPGYYFDPEKKRYFKVENSKTAPSEAPWSAENVKRRKVADNEAQLAQKRAEQAKGRVRRSRVLAEPLMGGFLLRETGKVSQELPVETFAQGLREKGKVPLSPPGVPSSTNISHLYIGNHENKLDFGLAYGSLDEESLVGCYIPRDYNDRIDDAVVKRLQRDEGMPRAEIIRCPQMSSLKYHEPSHKMLLTSREPGLRIGVSYFDPVLSSAGDSEPEWVIGGADHYENFTRYSSSRDCVANTCTPAPPSSDLICIIGTTEGVLKFEPYAPLTWINLKDVSASKPGDHEPRDIFSLDFLAGNHNIIFAGGRSNRISMMDLRISPDEWDTIRHKSSVGHLRSVNEHHLLAAGPRGAMSIYDLRFRRARPHGHRPLLTFPGFRNGAHMHFGLDVEPSLGIVAAAHDDGHVGVYSLRSGKRLACPPVDRVAARGVVRGVMFQTLPRDKNPSLFLGIGPNVCKYSFGVRDEAGEVLEE